MSSNRGKTFSVRQILDNQRAKRLSTKFRFLTENSLLLQTRTHRHTENKWRQLKSFLSPCMTSFVAKKQFGAGVTELWFCNERGFEASFFKLIEETDSQRQIHFCAGAWLEFKRFWNLKKKKKITVHVLTRFYSNVCKKSKWETAETGGNLTFLLAIFWEDKIKLCIMTACMLSALRKQHVCDVKKNCNSNIFTRNCWKTTHRWSSMLL